MSEHSHKARHDNNLTCVSAGVSLPRGLKVRSTALAQQQDHPTLSSFIQYLLWRELERTQPKPPEVKP